MLTPSQWERHLDFKWTFLGRKTAADENQGMNSHLRMLSFPLMPISAFSPGYKNSTFENPLLSRTWVLKLKFWRGSGQDKYIPKFEGVGLTMGFLMI